MQTKRGLRDRTYGAIEAFPEFLERFTPPAGPFDPHGAWKQTWAVHLFAQLPGYAGFLELERRPAAEGAVFTATTRLAHANGYSEQTFTIACAAGAPAPLRSLKTESVVGDLDGKPVAASRLAVSGEVRGAAIEWTRAGRKRSTPAPPPLVAAWALFDAVQRLKPGARPPAFTLLDDGDLVKPAQRLVYAGETSARTAAGSLALRCWEHTGEGILPAHYWVDAQGRMLFAVAGQKAYLYDPEARGRMAAGSRGRGRKKK